MIQEILNQMRSNGCDPGELICDQKIHRFKVANDKGTSGWYYGCKNFTRSGGEEFYVVRYGNYKTGEVHQYQSDIQLQPEDQAHVRKQIAKAKEKADQARREAQLEVANKVLEKWDRLDTNHLGEYLERKKIDQLYGSRGESTLRGRVTYVPLRDIDGKIWSLQGITFNGTKQFFPGGRIQGCFHIVGNIEQEETIYIAEGFATACSIFMATQKSVVVAFNASNLTPVADVLKKRYPDKTVVICGDDDIWTKKPDGSPWNPGREYGDQAANAVLGISIYPKFRVSEPGKTDFNDLHFVEGLETVREQILSAKPTKHYIVPLGYDGSDYYLLSNINPQIQKMTASQLASVSGLIRLQPLQYWENAFPSKQDGISCTSAMAKLIDDCHAKGIFNPSHVRGRGVWSDKDRLVYHMGNKLYFDKQEHALHRNALQSRYIYESAEALPPVHPNPLSNDEALDFLAIAKQIRWAKPDSYIFYAGWCAIAGIGGFLPWRPHIWITGASGTGKSYVMQDITYPLLKEFSQYFRGQTTEAGIRQESGSSTLPVIFDEFETDDEHSSNRIKAVLELARQASSDSDGMVAKGTVHGSAMKFKPQFSMMVASIRLNLTHEQDENRFAVLELSRGDAQTDQFDDLKTMVLKLSPDYGRRLFARSMALAGVIKSSSDVFSRVIVKMSGHTQRTGQQYGTLIAGFWSLLTDSVPTDEQATEFINQIDLSVAKAASERNDERECLDFLLQHLVYHPAHGDISIREFVNHAKTFNEAFGVNTYDQILQRLGIRVTKDSICIHGGHSSLSKIYRNTRWANNYGKQLLRLPGSKSNAVIFPVLGSKQRCVILPLEIMQ